LIIFMVAGVFGCVLSVVLGDHNSDGAAGAVASYQPTSSHRE